MKKFFFLMTMAMMCALYSHAAYYIVGSDPFGNWHPDAGVEMSDNGDGTYSYTAVIDGTLWFVFSDGLSSDWDVFNNQYRFGPNTYSDQTVSVDQWVTTQKQRNGSGAYRFTGTGDEYVLTFDPINLRFKIEGYIAPFEFTSFTVAGTPVEVFGTEWDNSNPDNDMVLGDDGLYSFEKIGLSLDAGTRIAYKIVGNHDWEYSWPVGNVEISVTETGNYNLKIIFDSETYQTNYELVLLTDVPAILYTVNPGNVTVTASGQGEIHLFADGIEVDNPCIIDRGEVDKSITFTATAQREGGQISETAYRTITIPAKETTSPVYFSGYADEGVQAYHLNIFPTEESVIYYRYQYAADDYTEWIKYENTLTFTQAGKYRVEAYAIAVDKLPSEVNANEFVISEVGPVDPHATGWWVVIKNAEGELEWYELHQGEDGSWVTTITLNYGQYGTFYWDPEKTAEENNMNRPNVPYYFVVDGQVWGAPEAEQETLMGAAANTMSNPLYENENFYTVPVGYSYVLGIYVDPSEDDQLQDGTWYYVYCVQGPQTDVNEVNAAKAVAGVRYYNLMGQEMQEANGMTIVVTTYTDGTTSAVKVMK